MAVQAQYPSDALFFNKTMQESDKATNFSLQAQTDKALPDQIQSSHTMIFNSNKNRNLNQNNNGIINQHKRGRDTSSAPFNSYSPFLLHQPQPQMVDISQLHHPPHNPLPTGLKLSSSNSIPIHSSLLSDHINNQLKQQQHEIEQLLLFQGEELQRKISENRQHHYRSLLTAVDESLKLQLLTKQSELEKALRRNEELETQATHLQNESNLWQAKARLQESTAASLQSQLHQALINKGVIIQGIGDEVERLRSEVDDAESVCDDPDRVLVVDGMERFVCKVCRRQQANVVILPCRHLCVCAVCDGDVVACPYCFTVKNSGVEVFMP